MARVNFFYFSNKGIFNPVHVTRLFLYPLKPSGYGSKLQHFNCILHIRNYILIFHNIVSCVPVHSSKLIDIIVFVLQICFRYLSKRTEKKTDRLNSDLNYAYSYRTVKHSQAVSYQPEYKLLAIENLSQSCDAFV